MFEVPITVVKPEPIQTIPRPRLERAGILFRPGDIVRSFVQVPDGATWATIRVYSNEQVSFISLILGYKPINSIK